MPSCIAATFLHTKRPQPITLPPLHNPPNESSLALDPIPPPAVSDPLAPRCHSRIRQLQSPLAPANVSEPSLPSTSSSAIRRQLSPEPFADARRSHPRNHAEDSIHLLPDRCNHATPVRRSPRICSVRNRRDAATNRRNRKRNATRRDRSH